eukprot:7929545-Prorocentrum_lima.AAC.1
MGWTFGKIPSPSATPTLTFTGDAAANKLLVLVDGDRAATDGSGGSRSDWRVRRCSWGVVIARDGKIFASVSGDLAGELQTVPRAELFALIALLGHTVGPVEVLVDC